MKLMHAAPWQYDVKCVRARHNTIDLTSNRIHVPNSESSTDRSLRSGCDTSL